MSDTVRVPDLYTDEFVEDCSYGDTSVVGCDGSFCGNEADTQIAYPLDDMPNIAFCHLCWTQEMNRRKRTGKGNVLPFPCSASDHGFIRGEVNVVAAMSLRAHTYLDVKFEKMRRAGRLED